MADGEKVETTRLSQYKPRKTSSCQEERRKQLLQEQKRLREEVLNERRHIIEEISTSFQKHPVQRSKVYKNKLMLSEWFLEIPSDFEDKWVMVPCPMGKRVLVLAGRGMTVVFAKDGRILSRFRSYLPGGHMEDGEPSKGVTILDCIWSGTNRSYYILDVLAWNNQHLINCDVDFRFYWLRTKVPENHDMSEKTKKNAYPFHLLPTFPCDKTTLETALNSHPLIPEVSIDGLLFYHVESHYTSGSTPLVGWLKPFMMPDFMQINVDQELLVEQPADYLGYRQYINDYENNVKRKILEKRAKRFGRQVAKKMDVSEAGESVELEEAGDCHQESSSVMVMDSFEEEAEVSMDASSGENDA